MDLLSLRLNKVASNNREGTPAEARVGLHMEDVHQGGGIPEN